MDGNFDVMIDDSVSVGKDWIDRTTVIITMPDGVQLGYRASQIVAALSAPTYTRSVLRWKGDLQRIAERETV